MSRDEQAETLRWALSLLEIHDGVRVNPNSQMWLARLREMTEQWEACTCGCPKHPGIGCWDALDRERKARELEYEAEKALRAGSPEAGT
jgi:hypothetical protein